MVHGSAYIIDMKNNEATTKCVCYINEMNANHVAGETPCHLRSKDMVNPFWVVEHSATKYYLIQSYKTRAGAEREIASTRREMPWLNYTVEENPMVAA